MDYIEINFKTQSTEEYVYDVLASDLSEIGFDSFVPNESMMTAYVPENLFDKVRLERVLNNFILDVEFEYEIKNIASKNWNEEWEKHYFQPIIIGNDCVIHSSFHKDIPKARYDIIIDPKMSFGTGHHETTSLMIEWLLQMNLDSKSLLDMGCGTSVLAILAAMRGAHPLMAIDIDEWCVENSIENISLNQVSGIEVKQGGAELLSGMSFDIVLANINRNILLNDMKKYIDTLPAGGELYMSGFYKEDIPMIRQEAERNGMIFETFKEKNNWVAVKTRKA